MRVLVLVFVLCLAPTSAFAVDAAAIWAKKCAGCHGDDGTANTPNGKKYKADDLTTQKFQKRHSDEKIQKYIENGVPGTKMPAFKERLSAEEISALVAHIRSLATK